MLTIAIPVKACLANYMYAKYEDRTFGGAIRLPDRGMLYHIFGQLTDVRPKNDYGRETGNLILFLPSPDLGKSPKTYNYLSTKSIGILEEWIELEMNMELFEEIERNYIKKGIPRIKTIEGFIEKYNLIDITEEALDKRYRRWKKLQEEKRKKS